MVFVNINYRVGPFGFLASEKVRNDGDLNAGFLDERLALEWVQKYISKVGFLSFIHFNKLISYLLSSGAILIESL